MEKFYRYTTKKIDGATKHVKTEMTSKEVKAFIMQQNGWTADQYRKQYDIFKNKLNAYESYQASRGVAVEHQSVTAVLFKEARSKALYGDEYKPSQKMQQIRSFSAHSITKGRQLAQGDTASARRYQAKEEAKYNEYIQRRFGGFIESNPTAQKIDAMIKDPVKKEKALSDLADKLKTTIDEQGKAEANEAIPFSSETYGSGEEIDFDIEDYLD